MKLLIYLTIFITLYFIYGIYLSQSNLLVIPSTVKPENPSGYYDYKGIINIHSNLSTGSENPQQIINAANVVGSDFVVFTDNNLFETPRPVSNYYENMLVMFENEYSFLDSRVLTLTANSDLNFEILKILK